MEFLAGSFKIGRLFDVEIRIHILFVLFVGFQLLTARGGFQEELLFWGMLFGIVLVHEYGHIFGARSVGGEAHVIMLWPLGGLAYASAPMRPWAQFVTVACGPLVNVIFCIAAFAVLWISGAGPVPQFNPLIGGAIQLTSATPGAAWQYYLAIFYAVNYFLLMFNLLPIYPLDGGQLFQTILWPFLGLQRAMMLACQVGIAGAIVLAVLGLQSGGGILFFIALFGGLRCFQMLRAVREGYIIETPVYEPINRPRRPNWWSRFKGRFGRSGGGRSGDVAPRNPNPGAWERRVQAERDEEAEIDRILKKVHEQGIHSLSYPERSRLERATRARQQRERGS